MSLGNRVEVKLYRRKKPESGFYYLVRLHSLRKVGFIAERQVDVGAERVRSQVGATAGALAEYLDEKYDDWHDPSDCARAALACFDKLQSEIRGKPGVRKEPE